MRVSNQDLRDLFKIHHGLNEDQGTRSLSWLTCNTSRHKPSGGRDSHKEWCCCQGWEDVGGMSEVRDALRESLELPTRYAKLVAKAPLRLRTGAYCR